MAKIVTLTSLLIWDMKTITPSLAIFLTAKMLLIFRLDLRLDSVNLVPSIDFCGFANLKMLALGHVLVMQDLQYCLSMLRFGYSYICPVKSSVWHFADFTFPVS